MVLSKNLVLVEPSGTLNLGSIARLCKNYEINALRLVNPKCNPNDELAMRMAVKGKIFLEKPQIFNSLLDAIKDCNKIITTCGRIDHGDLPLETPNEAIRWLLDVPYDNRSCIALVFGREDSGLNNQELLLGQKIININTGSKYNSLNLSHAVAIILNELQYCELSKKSGKDIVIKDKNIALASQLNACLDDAEKLLLDIGFLLSHTANSRMRKIRSILQKAEVSSNELALIRGIIRQIKWAIKEKPY